MTAQWTIDDNGNLSFRHQGVDWWLRFEALHSAWRPFGSADLAIAAHAALVADVRAARLVDDMAAVVRRYEDHWRPSLRKPGWWECDRPSPVRLSELMEPGEVAALHHARQQEAT